MKPTTSSSKPMLTLPQNDISLTRRRAKMVWLEIVVALLCVIVFLPLVLVVINAAKNPFEVTNQPLALPERWITLFENIKTIWTSENIQYRQSVISSIIITTLSLIVITITSSMAAWALVRTKTKLSLILFMIFVGAMVIPFQVVMLPLISWFRILGNFTGIKMLRSYTGIIFAYAGFGAPLSIFLFHGFIKAIPIEIEDAARVDGCNRLQTFFHIVSPLLKPVYITVIILNGIWIWNDFLLPVLVLGKGNSIQTIPLAVANFVGAFVKEWGLILTAALMSIIPIIILFIFAQKYIIRGMVEGSIK